MGGAFSRDWHGFTRVAAMGLVLASASCAGLDRRDQGLLQPQTVDGPCQVEKFFLLGFTTVHTKVAARDAGQACTFTILNPAEQAVATAALVTVRPAHGVATAELIGGNRQVLISYLPQRGYAGPDRFTVTIEPNAHGIDAAVSVQP